MRIRSRTTSKPTTVTIVDTPGGSSSSQTTFGWEGRTEYIEDEVHPGFRKAQKNGSIIMGKLLMSKIERSIGISQLTFGTHPLWGSRTVSGDVCGYLSADGSVPEDAAVISSMQSCVLVSAFAKLSQADVMSGEFLGSLPQTLSMLKRPMSGVQKVLAHHLEGTKRLGRMKAGRRATKALADSVLEFQYGVRPLIMDAASIMNHYDEKKRQGSARLVVRAQNSHNSMKRVAVSANPTGGYQLTGTATFNRTVRSSAGVIFHVYDMDAFRSTSKVLGFQAEDFASTLWELTPWSFVVDWAVNVGDWIAACSPRPGINVLGSWRTTVDESVNSFADLKATLYVGTAPATTYTASPKPSITKSVSVVRDVNPSLPLTPVIKPKMLALTQVQNGLSLIASSILADAHKVKVHHSLLRRR